MSHTHLVLVLCNPCWTKLCAWYTYAIAVVYKTKVTASPPPDMDTVTYMGSIVYLHNCSCVQDGHCIPATQAQSCHFMGTVFYMGSCKCCFVAQLTCFASTHNAVIWLGVQMSAVHTQTPCMVYNACLYKHIMCMHRMSSLSKCCVHCTRLLGVHHYKVHHWHNILKCNGAFYKVQGSHVIQNSIIGIWCMYACACSQCWNTIRIFGYDDYCRLLECSHFHQLSSLEERWTVLAPPLGCQMNAGTGLLWWRWRHDCFESQLRIPCPDPLQCPLHCIAVQVHLLCCQLFAHICPSE